MKTSEGISEAIVVPKVVRDELGLSQAELADLLGVSPRTVQSWEQGWRYPSSALERLLLLLLIACRQGESFGGRACWEEIGCSPAVREACLPYQTRQGHLCWFLTGNKCRGRRLRNWPDKLSLCRECSFFQALLRGNECA